METDVLLYILYRTEISDHPVTEETPGSLINLMDFFLLSHNECHNTMHIISKISRQSSL